MFFLGSLQRTTTSTALREDFSYVVRTPNLLKEAIQSPESKNETLQEAPSEKKARDLEMLGQVDEALSLYYSLYTKDQSNEEYLSKIAGLLVKKESWSSAHEAYKKLFANPSHTNEVTLGYINTLLHLQSTPLKTEQITTIASILANLQNAENEKNYYTCILALSTEKNIKDSCQVLATSIDTKSSTLWKEIEDRLHRFDSQRDGKETYLSLMLSGLLSENGWYNLSFLKAKEVLLAQNEYRDAWILTGYDLIQMKEYQKALFYLEEAYKKDTTKVHVQYLLGVAHDHLGNKEKAISYYTIALKNKFPAEKDIIKRIGELYVSLGKYDLALEISLQTLKDKPNLSPDDYLSPLWILLNLQANPQKASEIAGEGLKKFPEDKTMEGIYQWSLCYQEDTKNDAYKRLKELGTSSPELIKVKVLATRCAIQMKNKKEALELLTNLKQQTATQEIYRQIQDLTSLTNAL